ncbi:MAG: GntR family transcriptional regulator [Clostridia bacterium]|nr:GntR family transcriptional regulator [Clostridia bacterium]
MIFHGISKLLYLQIRDVLVEQIESGKLSPGDALPGERTMAEMFDVSRVTIRKCIGNMVEEGYLIRSRGKETIVASRKVSHRLGTLLGVVEELSEANKTIKVKVLYKGYEKITTDIRNHLNTEDNAQVYAFSRLIFCDDKPLVVNYSHVLQDIGKLVESLDLESDRVFQHLENCGYNVSYAEQMISAGICNKKEAELLNYKVGQPVIVIKRTTFLENGYPILYEKSTYRGEEYQYSIKLLRKSGSGNSQRTNYV